MPGDSLEDLFVEVPDELAKQIEAATAVRPVGTMVNTKTGERVIAEVPWLPREEELDFIIEERALLGVTPTPEDYILTRLLTKDQRSRVKDIQTRADTRKNSYFVKVILRPEETFPLTYSGKSAEAFITDDLTVDFSGVGGDAGIDVGRTLANGTPRPKWYDDPATGKQVGLLRSMLMRSSHDWSEFEVVVGREFDSFDNLTKGEASNLITWAKKKGLIK